MKKERLKIEIDAWFKSLASMEREKIKKNIYDKWLSNINYNTARGYIIDINNALEKIGVEPFKPKDFELKKESKGIYTYSDILEGINFMIKGIYNSQDIFIVLAIFNGILGKSASDLLNLKKEKINVNTGIIYTENREIKMDDFMCRFASDSMTEKTYYSLKGNTMGEYEINLASDYILTPRPTKKNSNGTEPLSYAGLRTRFYSISESMDMELTMEGLYRSGVAYRMYQDGVKKTRGEVYSWLEKNKIKVCKNTMLNIYKDLY